MSIYSQLTIKMLAHAHAIIISVGCNADIMDCKPAVVGEIYADVEIGFWEFFKSSDVLNPNI